MSEPDVYPPPQPAALNTSAVRFSLKGDVHPGLIPRVIEQFAKRSLVPDKVSCRRRSTKNGGTLTVRIWMSDADRCVMEHVGRCLSQIPGVAQVLMDGTKV